MNVFVTGRAQQLLTLDSRWAWSIIVGAVLALAIYILLRARLAPFAYRVLELGPKAASGDASAAAEQAALIGRIRRLGYVQLGVGLVIVLAMITARYS